MAAIAHTAHSISAAAALPAVTAVAAAAAGGAAVAAAVVGAHGCVESVLPLAARECPGGDGLFERKCPPGLQTQPAAGLQGL